MNTNTKNYPRVLVFANNCFSKTNSNGRTLAGFFDGFPKDKIAQFYIQNDVPDFDVCNNYYCVTDGQVLKSFFKHKPCGTIKKEDDSNQNIVSNNKKHKKIKKNPISMMIREKVWKNQYWRGASFDEWISSFSPQIVVLQAGDSAFMFDLATDIAKQFNIPLVIYNSENYYFKTKNYMKDAKLSKIFYKFFIKRFRKSFDNAIDYASASIYNSKSLKKLYDEKFKKKSYFIYTSTTIQSGLTQNPHITKISYLGNLGVGRHEPLVDIANALKQINPNYNLDVYGKIPSALVKKAFENSDAISYKGFVSYNEVVGIMKNSTLIVHAENFSDFYKEDLKYAFSTKIADSLACGTCLFYYAPEELASTKYLKETDSACVVTNKTNLLKTLEEIIANEDARKNYVNKALEIAEINHNFLANRSKFLQILRNCI